MWEIEEHVEQEPSTQSRYGAALLLSLAAHLALFVWLFSMQTSQKITSVNVTSPKVTLRLLPSLAAPVEIAPPPSNAPQETQAAEPTRVELPTPVTPSFDFTLPPQTQSVPAPSAPTTLQLRQLVDSFIGPDAGIGEPRCTAGQLFSELIECPDTTGLTDVYSQADATFDFFNDSSRNSAQRQLQAQQTERLASSLSNSGLSNAQIDSFMNDIDVQRQEQNTSTNARLDSLRDNILSNDATHQIKKRVLNP